MIQFPSGDAIVTGKKCKTCGFVMVLTKGDPDRDKCFCCTMGIPLPLAAPGECPDCSGTGVVATHVCRDGKECQRKCPKEEQCAACLGTGRRG